MRILLYFLLQLIVVSAFSQDTLRVPSQFNRIQTALNAASNNAVVLVASGTYNENLIWPEFVIGIDLISEEGSEFTTIDGGNNGKVIYKNTRNEFGSIIKGFEITNGNADDGGGIWIKGVGTDLDGLDINGNRANDSFGQGGGIYLESYGGLISNCRITRNRVGGVMTADGGGLYVNGLDGDLYIENSTISSNIANGGNSSNGGGAFIGGKDHLVSLTDVSFIDNSTSHLVWSRYAGAYINADIVSIVSCTFLRNSNNENAENSEGGGLTVLGEQITIEQCDFLENEAELGSSILLAGDSETFNIDRCSYSLNKGEFLVYSIARTVTASITNCLMTRNEGFIFQSNPSSFSPLFPTDFHFNHVTIVNNDDGLTLGIGHIHVSNSIIWNNGVLNEDGEFLRISDGSLRVNSSIVRGGYPGASVIDIDPQLDFDNYFPLSGSPALDYGNPAFTALTSFNGNPRPLPNNTLPDIGAIELNQPVATALVRFFYDDNQDGIKTLDEPFMPIGNVAFEGREFRNFSTDGLSFRLSIGNQNLNFVPTGLDDWLLTTQDNYVLMVTDSLYSEEFLFGLAPKVDSINISSFITMDPFRCGERIPGSVSYQNDFNLIPEVTLFLEVDERIEEIEFTIPPNNIDEDTYSWRFEEILPLQEESLDFRISVPPVMNAAQVGELYTFKSWIDIDETGSVFEYIPELRCSFDPNDKNVNDRNLERSQLENTTLSYRIRFQNTGNDYARDVTVIDTLNGNLDLSSFDIKGSSHPENLIVTVVEDSIFSFYFREIFLIDSLTDPELSNGYIDFTIKPKSTLQSGDELLNTAFIIFDSNPPIRTNTTVSIVTSPSSTEGDHIENTIDIFPNPASTTLNFTSNPHHIRLYSSSGNLMLEGSLLNTLDVSELNTGIYLIQMDFGDNKIYTEMIFIE